MLTTNLKILVLNLCRILGLLMPLKHTVAQHEIARGDDEMAHHDGEADLKELHERELVAVLLGHSGAHHVCACAD